MKLIDKNILLISPEPWSHLFVSKHHYAVHLAKRGNKVYFLNPPSKQTVLNETNHENIKVLCYNGFIKGFRMLPGYLQRFLIRNKLNMLERVAGVQFDIVWSFDNSVFFDFNAISDRVLTISHIVDLNQNFMLRKAAKTADFCFYNNKFIGEKLGKVNQKSFFIHHGYSNLVNGNEINIPFFQGIKIGYAGNLDIKYIDWDLIWEVARNTPQAGFYFAGTCQNKEITNVMEKLENCYYLGRIASDALWDFYRQMDILIIAYKADQYSEQLANPHKMMEYLGSGKTIVATYTAEYDHLKDLILMSRKNAEWPEILKRAIENVKAGTDMEKIMLRQDFAFNNSYRKQIDRIEAIIDKDYNWSYG